MGEGGIAYHGNRWELPCVSSTFCHSDRGSHIHATVQSLEWWQCSKSVAANVSEDASPWEFCCDFVEGFVYISVSASVAKCRWSANYVGDTVKRDFARDAKRLGDIVRIEFPGARKSACKPSEYRIACSKYGVNL